MTTSSYGSRRRLIRRLLTQERIHNQQELVILLAEAGHEVTQATVSRDLEALGALKVANNGNSIYALPVKPTDEAQRELARTLNDFVIAMEPSGNLAVLRTPPGAAHVVASSLDNAGLDEVVGSVAGDDTVIVVASEAAGGTGLVEILEKVGVSI